MKRTCGLTLVLTHGSVKCTKDPGHKAKHKARLHRWIWFTTAEARASSREEDL